MGGRFVLIKAVLKSKPVYWLALAHIPFSILNRIHMLAFSYLCTGAKNHSSFHLCKWETIAHPKKFGSWGLRNIFFFLRALAAKSLWRGLMVLGIWHRVLKDKYLSHLSVVSWFCTVDPAFISGSSTWRNLVNALPLLLHWLAWKPGAGSSITVGKDEILGLGKRSFLSPELISLINSKHVHFLYQAKKELV